VNPMDSTVDVWRLAAEQSMEDTLIRLSVMLLEPRLADPREQLDRLYKLIAYAHEQLQNELSALVNCRTGADLGEGKQP